MIEAPMNPVHVVAVLAVIQYLVFAALVGRARVRHGVKAPATSGPEPFERCYRVQMNTLEQLVAFLPALLLAGIYWPSALIAAIGAVYLVGRQLYRQHYLGDPRRRAPGFILTVLPTFALLIAALAGALGLAAR